MNLLDKFDQVEVKADSRISEEDRIFCQTHQEAYDLAREGLEDMARIAAQYQERELSVLSRIGKKRYVDYFTGDSAKCYEALDRSHSHFIHTLVSHFRTNYNVELDDGKILELLIPQEPCWNPWSLATKEASAEAYKEAYEQYTKKKRSLALRYEDILDQIFIQLGGFSFQDKALQEMKDRCHDAAWNKYYGTKCYSQKKAVLTFSDRFCHWDLFYSTPHISLSAGMKHIVEALSFYEFGVMRVAYPLNDLCGYSFGVSEFEFESHCSKLKGIKCFKNGRVDVRFQNEAFAREFAETFLGTEAA